MENTLEKAKQAYAESCGSSNFEELKYMSSENEERLTANALLFYEKMNGNINSSQEAG